MREDHCLVKKDGYTVPLIGVPVGSGLERCDLCGDAFPLWDVEYTGQQMLCQKCRMERPQE